MDCNNPPTDEDLDGDQLHNVCDDADAPMNIRRARVRRSDGKGGHIIVKGEILLASPADALNVAEGLAVQVRDALNLDEIFTWTGAECQQRPTSGRIRCRNATGVMKGALRPHGSGQRLRFSFRFQPLNLPGPDMPFEPDLTVRMTDSPQSK